MTASFGLLRFLFCSWHLSVSTVCHNTIGWLPSNLVEPIIKHQPHILWPSVIENNAQSFFVLWTHFRLTCCLGMKSTCSYSKKLMGLQCTIFSMIHGKRLWLSCASIWIYNSSTSFLFIYYLLALVFTQPQLRLGF